MRKFDLVGLLLIAMLAGWIVFRRRASELPATRPAARVGFQMLPSATTKAVVARRPRIRRQRAVASTQSLKLNTQGGIAAEATAPDQQNQDLVPTELAEASVAFVGVDPQAEEVWLEALDDDTQSDAVHQQLIEGLAVEGFDDPGHVTQDDLPLIEARMELIDEIRDGFDDDISASAFERTYARLAQMREQAALPPSLPPAPDASPTPP